MILIEIIIVILAVLIVLGDLFWSSKSKAKSKPDPENGGIGSDYIHTNTISSLREELGIQNKKIYDTRGEFVSLKSELSSLKENLEVNSKRLEDEISKSNSMAKELHDIKQQLNEISGIKQKLDGFSDVKQQLNELKEYCSNREDKEKSKEVNPVRNKTHTASRLEEISNGTASAISNGVKENTQNKAGDNTYNNAANSSPESEQDKATPAPGTSSQNSNYISIDEHNKLKQQLEAKNRSLNKMYLPRRISNIKKSLNNKIDRINKTEKVEKKENRKEEEDKNL